MALLLAVVLSGLLLGSEGYPAQPVPERFAGRPIGSQLGVNTHFTEPLPGEMEMIREGFGWIRTDLVSWGVYESQKGVYNFSMTDNLMEQMNATGFGYIAILSCCNPLYDNGEAPTSAEGIRAYANFAAALVSHYAGYTNVFWEIINEPNNGAYKHNGTAYSALSTAAADAIHGASASAVVVGPASANIDMAFLKQAFEADLLQHVDAVTVHPYRSDSPETFVQDFAKLRDLVAEYSPLDRTVPVISGEWGYAEDASLGIDEGVQADLVTRQLLLTATLTGMPTIWYEWRDNPTEPMGVVNQTYNPRTTPPFTPKLAFGAAVALTKVLGDSVFVDRVPVFQNGGSTEDDFCLVFRRDKTTVLALWTSGSFPHVVRLPGGRGCWDVVDRQGGQLPRICEDSRGIHVNVSASPLYLTQ